MLTNKEFNDAITAVGGKFFANTYNYLADNIDLETGELVDKLFLLGYDSAKSGTRTRVSSAKRLIKDDSGIRALKKIASSNKIEKNAVELARHILKERFNIVHYEDISEKITY